MPKFRIAGSFGFAGTDFEDIVEAESLEEAEEIARDYVIDRVEWCAELIEEKTKEDDNA